MSTLFISIFSLISAAALILIYSMRVRRKAQKVPALFLWQRLRHISIDQPLLKRFFRDKLFYLHAAILILLLAALLQSGLRKSSAAGQRAIFIIDISASMKALENGESRIELAKKKALSIFKKNESAEVMIISAGITARQILPYSVNRDEIINALKRIEPQDTAADIEDALLMIKPYIKENGRIYLFSDGAFEGLSSLIDETPNLFFIQVGGNGENAGVLSLEIHRGENGAYTLAEVSLKNFGQQDVISTVDILSDGKVIDAQRIKLPAGEEKNMAFDRLPAFAENIAARLNHEDALMSDNYRYAVMPAPAYSSVLLVTNENFYLNKLLERLENYHLTLISPETYEMNIKSNSGMRYDIGIYDNYAPSAEISRASIYINPERDIYGISWADELFMPEDMHSLKEHPVMSYTDFSDIRIRKARKAVSFEGLELLGSSESPLIIISKRDGKERVIFGFDIKDSNFPKSVNFPVFFTNLLNRLQSDDVNCNISSGDSFSLHLPVRKGKALVKYPDGRERNTETENGVLVFSDTSIAGIYSIMHGGREIKFAVNIPPAESDIKPAEFKHAAETVKTDNASLISFPAMWKIFGILAVMLLLAEMRIRERILS
ncbi:MAG: VWA domain-containing protein [Nitrospirae bacterium]|nr:VWA domain-containing protein [Nitrospirota bacterium]